MRCRWLTGPAAVVLAAGALSAWTPGAGTPVAAASARAAQVRVVTYNVLSSTFDGTPEGNGTVAPWSQRRPRVAALLRAAHADVITVQEGSGIVVPYSTGHPSVRQVDQIAADLAGSGFRLDDTSVGTGPAGRYTGNYILYRRAALIPVGTGGHWSIGDGRYASYQLFRPAVGGRTFLFVATHLVPGVTSANNAQRGRETATLTRLARGVAGGVPIVYAGDFNTYPRHTGFVDTPGKAMRAAGATDTWSMTTRRYNASYSSLNQYLRLPKRGTGNADHVFVTAGVSAYSTGVELVLTRGRFVGVIPSDHNPLWATLLIAG